MNDFSQNDPIDLAIAKLRQGKSDFSSKESYNEKSVAHQLFINGLENLIEIAKFPNQHQKIIDLIKQKINECLPDAAQMKQQLQSMQSESSKLRVAQTSQKVVKIIHRQSSNQDIAQTKDKIDPDAKPETEKSKKSSKKTSKKAAKKNSKKGKTEEQNEDQCKDSEEPPAQNNQAQKRDKSPNKAEQKAKSMEEQKNQMPKQQGPKIDPEIQLQCAQQLPQQKKQQNLTPKQQQIPTQDQFQAAKLYGHMQQQNQNKLAQNMQQQKQIDNDQLKLNGQLQQAIVMDKPNVSWDDIAGLEQAKKSLQEAVILPIKFPQLFNKIRKPWKGILMYGPPGTGKTYLAKACASQSQSTFFSVSTADLMSKYVGESAKLMRTLFDLARKSKPSIIFIDEIDSLTGARQGDKDNDSQKGVITEFLAQTDGMSNDNTGIMILGATNLPWNIDAAVRRRFEKRVCISLPEKEARENLLKNNLQYIDHELSDKDISAIAQQTEGFSGADLTILIKEASFQPLRFSQEAKHFKKVEVDGQLFYLACENNDKDGYKMNIWDIPSNQLYLPPINYQHFLLARKKIKSSVSQLDLKQYEQFTEKFGEDG